MDKLTKAFIALNNNIDAELDKTYQKLSDKYLNLKLSHNRKTKALQKILAVVIGLEDNLGLDKIIKETCESALYSDGRIFERKTYGKR